MWFDEVSIKHKHHCKAMRHAKPVYFHSNEEDTTLGGRISMARETSGLSVGQVVKRLGVKATTYEAWEADRSEPRANKLVALAGILNISPPYLLSGLGKTTQQVGPPRTANWTTNRANRTAGAKPKNRHGKPAPDQTRRSKDEIEPLNEHLTPLRQAQKTEKAQSLDKGTLRHCWCGAKCSSVAWVDIFFSEKDFLYIMDIAGKKAIVLAAHPALA